MIFASFEFLAFLLLVLAGRSLSRSRSSDTGSDLVIFSATDTSVSPSNGSTPERSW